MSEENQELTPDQQEQLLKLKTYLINNAARIEQWAKAHSKQSAIASNPPIYWNPFTREFYWKNRKARRS